MANINKLPLGYFTMDFVDFEYYLQSLDQDCYLEMPEVHYEMCVWIQTLMEAGEERILGLAPRKISKTQIWGRHLPLWMLLRDPETCVLLYSADKDLAVQNSASIQRLIQTVPLCQRLLPENHKALWTKTAFNVRGHNSMRKESSIFAKGILSSIVGQHPDWILSDDIEIDKNVTNDDNRKGVRKKVSQMIPAVSENVFMWGTYWTQDSTYIYAQNELGFHNRTWQMYEPFITGIETEDEIESYIWKERWDYEKIQQMKFMRKKIYLL